MSRITPPGERRHPSVPLRPRRNPRWIAAGLAAMCLGGVGSVALWTQATHSEQVLQLAGTVQRGERIEAADLVVVTVGQLPDGTSVPAAELERLVGQQALVELRQGALLPPASVGDVVVEPGQVLVGLRLEPGRIPAQPLSVGTEVLLVGVPTGQGEPADALVRARVVTPTTALPDGGLTVDVAVAQTHAQTVARLAATDQLALVKEADG